MIHLHVSLSLLAGKLAESSTGMSDNSESNLEGILSPTILWGQISRRLFAMIHLHVSLSLLVRQAD